MLRQLRCYGENEDIRGQAIFIMKGIWSLNFGSSMFRAPSRAFQTCVRTCGARPKFEGRKAVGYLYNK